MNRQWENWTPRAQKFNILAAAFENLHWRRDHTSVQGDGGVVVRGAEVANRLPCATEDVDVEVGLRDDAAAVPCPDSRATQKEGGGNAIDKHFASH